jgi:putative peptidoglycan lipid II flippase
LTLDTAARRRLPRIVAAAAVMGCALWLATTFAAGPQAQQRGVAQAALLLVLIAGAVAVYGLLLAAFGVTGWREAIAALRQKPSPHLRDDLHSDDLHS